MPLINAPPGCGVVLEDPPHAGFHPHLLKRDSPVSNQRQAKPDTTSSREALTEPCERTATLVQGHTPDAPNEEVSTSVESRLNADAGTFGNPGVFPDKSY